jgi:hypothetical protein
VNADRASPENEATVTGDNSDNGQSASDSTTTESTLLPAASQENSLLHCGIRICPNLEQHSGLDWDDKVLLSKIDSLVIHSGGPCWAKNETLAKWFGRRQSQMDHMLARLQREELILRRFYGKFTLRIVTPGYSANPELSEKIRQSWSKNESSLVNIYNPSLVKNEGQPCKKLQTEDSVEDSDIEKKDLVTPNAVSGPNGSHVAKATKQKQVESASRPETREECVEHCTKIGLTENDGKALWDHWSASGFKVHGKPMHSWKHKASDWGRRRIFFPSLQEVKR